MAGNKTDETEYIRIADELGLSVSEVRKAVTSFFAEIALNSDRLPFDDERKIFTREKFKEYCRVSSIPYIGRIGPVYSRYLKWRANEARELPSENRSAYKKGLSRSEIEAIAKTILSGGTPQIQKKKNSELFNRVWMVGKNGKKSARQVIPKEDKDV